MRSLPPNFFVVYEGIISDLVGSNDHDLSIVSINSHTHIGAKILSCFPRFLVGGFLVAFQDCGESSP
jgi:hypothetical protein